MDDRSLYVAIIALTLFITFAIAIFTSYLFYRTIRYIPTQKRIFPNAFIWFTFMPFIGYIFQWLMIPFGIPMGLKNTFPDNPDALRDADSLKKLGLTIQILFTLFLLCVKILAPYHSLLLSCGFALVSLLICILWIVYWVKLGRFRKRYFINARTPEADTKHGQ